MKPYDLSQYMYHTSLTTGAGLMGYAATETYPPATVGEAIKNLAASSGSAGGSGVVTTEYTYNANTALPPALGEIRFDGAPGVATNMKVSQTTIGGVDVGLAFSYLAPGQRVYIQQKDDATRFVKATVVGTPVDQGDWWLFPILVTEASVPTITEVRCVIGWPASAASGSGTPTNVLPKGGMGGGFANSQFFDDGINVGLGTGTPASKLHIKGSGLVVRMETATARGLGQDSLAFYDPSGIKAYLGYNSDDKLWLNNVLGTDLGIATNNIERMTVLADGKVGVGIALPIVQFHVQGSVSPQVGITTTVARGGGACALSFFDPTGQKGWLGYAGVNDDFQIGNGLNGSIAFIANGTEHLRIGPTGNIGVASGAKRFSADFSSVPVSNRLVFQTSTLNGTTGINVTPNGTGNSAAIAFLNTSDPDNGSYVGMYSTPAASVVVSDKVGSGAYLPLNFSVGGTSRMQIATDGTVGIPAPFATGSSSKFYVNADMTLYSGDNSAQSYHFNGYYQGAWKAVAIGYTAALRFDANAGQLQFWMSRSKATSAGQDVTSVVGIGMTLDANYNAAIYGSTLALNGGGNGLWQHDGSNMFFRPINANSTLYLGAVSANTLAINPTTVYPPSDNAINLGWGGGRFIAVWAVNGAIQTSDAREKRWRGGLSPEELAAAKDIGKEIGVYQWLSSLEEKGEDARLHVGVLAQMVDEIMTRHGLDAHRYGFFCYDEWEEHEQPTGEDNAMEVVPAGNRYAVRYDELWGFVLAAQEQRLAALEAR